MRKVSNEKRLVATKKNKTKHDKNKLNAK